MMFRRSLAALCVAVLLVVAFAASTGAQSEPSAPVSPVPSTEPAAPPVRPQCPRVSTHRWLIRKALRYSQAGGDYTVRPVAKRFVREAAAARVCVRSAGYRHRYHVMRRQWRTRAAAYRFTRHIDRITPYGKWALPAYIVMRESGGDRCAKNPSSTAGGYYQFLTTTWQAYGGRGSAQCAPAWEQHEVAARAWAGGAGAHHWALTV